MSARAQWQTRARRWEAARWRASSIDFTWYVHCQPSTPGKCPEKPAAAPGATTHSAQRAMSHDESVTHAEKQERVT